MTGFAIATSISFVVRTTKEMDFLVGSIRMIPQLTAAIGAIKKIAKHILLAVLLFRSTAFHLYNERLTAINLYCAGIP